MKSITTMLIGIHSFHWVPLFVQELRILLVDFLVLLYQLYHQACSFLGDQAMAENTRSQASFVKWKNVSAAKWNQDFSSSLLPCNKQYTECFNRGNKILQHQAINLEVRDLALILVALDWLGWTFQDSMVKE